MSVIEFPAGLEEIGVYAFQNCTSLTSITIPASVTFIGKYAFYGTSLTSVVFENSSGWKLENDVTSEENGSVVLLNLNKSTSSGAYRYVYKCNLASTTTAANALTSRGTVVRTTTYSGSGIGSGSSETDTYHGKLYTENWYRS